jgi:hypothetical protein
MSSSFTRFLDHTQRRITVCRTPLDEWSARRRDLYLTTHNTHNRQTSVPQLRFEPTIPAGERPHIYTLDRAATWTEFTTNYFPLIYDQVSHPQKRALYCYYARTTISFRAHLNITTIRIRISPWRDPFLLQIKITAIKNISCTEYKDGSRSQQQQQQHGHGRFRHSAHHVRTRRYDVVNFMATDKLQ